MSSSTLISRFTGAAGVTAANTFIQPGKPFELLEVRVHLNAASATSENLVISLDGGAAAAKYDTVLATQDMNTVADYVYTPTRPHRFTHASDKLIMTWTNTNTKTYGIEIVYRHI